MRISSIILRVSDTERSTAFWSEIVGLGIVGQISGFTFLNGGDVQLILSHVDSDATDESLTEVVFGSDDVRGTFAETAERGVPFELELRPITSDGDRQLLGAHFRDPDGHYGSLTGWVEKE